MKRSAHAGLFYARARIGASLDQIELVYVPAGRGRGRPRIRRHLGEPTKLQLDLLAARAEDGTLRFDVRLQGERQTVFFAV